jgi:hypothetical protein
VDTSDRFIGRRGDLFRASHARLLSGISAKIECQGRSIETAELLADCVPGHERFARIIAAAGSTETDLSIPYFPLFCQRSGQFK